MATTNLPSTRPQLPPPKNARLLLVAAVLITVAVIVWSIRPTVSRVPGASERMVTSNNLKQIGLAFQNFDAKRGALPLGAICDDEGKPLLSWRVALLPYLEENELYEQFKLDEPWDSPTNKPLIAKMPKVYASPKQPAGTKDGRTFYKVFVGDKTVFRHTPSPRKEDDDTEPLNRWSIHGLYGSPRGLANLLFVAEAGDSVVWTKPSDFEMPESGPIPGLKPLFPESIYVLMGDGSVKLVRPSGSNFEEALRASLDPDDESGVVFEE